MAPGMEDLALYKSVVERFPESSERITLLLQQDAEFAEICSDYEEVADWLAAHSRDGCAYECSCAANRQLLSELEADILEALQEWDHQSRRWEPNESPADDSIGEVG